MYCCKTFAKAVQDNEIARWQFVWNRNKPVLINNYPYTEEDYKRGKCPFCYQQYIPTEKQYCCQQFEKAVKDGEIEKWKKVWAKEYDVSRPMKLFLRGLPYTEKDFEKGICPFCYKMFEK